MNSKTNIYLLILHSRSGFNEHNKGMFRIDTKTETNRIIDYPKSNEGGDSLPGLGEGKLILCYDETNILEIGLGDEEETKLRKKCRELLRNAIIINGSNVRIFYHRSGDFKGLKEIRDDFSKEFWSEADVMPYSQGLRKKLPWVEEIDSVCNDFLNVDKMSFDSAFTKLDAAWNIAFSYYNIDQAIQVLLESLFPLYVDLSNREYSDSRKAGFQAILDAVKGNIKVSLECIGSQGSAQELISTLVASRKSSTRINNN